MAKKKPGIQFPDKEDIIQKSMEDVLHDSMIPYAEYVILERALPRVEDGLKPVQRRILYAMMELGLTPDKPYRKCARIVGDTLGKYHPHGDTSVYDALVRMAQPFSMRGLLVDGHGNFGSIDGDQAAAMRYTEARMAPLALELLRDLEKDTVDYRLNFDDTLREPDTLPGRYPNLLVNGASGIAVGIATSIPPHNLGETIDATLMLLENPEAQTEDLMQALPAPDFPTGGVLLRDAEIVRAYETGRGRLRLRARVDIEPGPAGRKLIVIHEVPYQVNKAAMLEKIQKLREEKKGPLALIHDIRDESDREGMRAVIELKRDADIQKTLAYLYKYSDMQVTFGVNMVAIAGGKPVLLGLRACLEHFIRHQRDVVTRRTRYDLEQARAREHILSGLMIALDNLDAVIKLIRASKNPAEAREGLMASFGLSKIQAQAILDMRLQRLTNLESQALRKEHKEILAKIKKLQGILDNDDRLVQLIAGELREIRERYADPRRTKLMRDDNLAEIAAQPEKEEAQDIVVVWTQGGFIKRLAPRSFKPGEQGDDPARAVLDMRTDMRLCFFTDKGNCYLIRPGTLPEHKPRDRGLALTGILPDLEDGETGVAVFALAEEELQDEKQAFYFVTRNGMIKSSLMKEYHVRKTKFAAVSLKGGDTLTTVWRGDGAGYVMMVTKKGQSILFSADSVPRTGRVSAGVKAIALGNRDELLWAEHLPGVAGELLLITDRGYMKRSLLIDYEIQGRNGKGQKTWQFQKSGANGQEIVAAFIVREPFTIAIEQKDGTRVEVSTEEVRIEARNAHGLPYVMALMDNIITGARALKDG